ncbi:Ulp1 protease family, C-terminal catalytic domain containing protein [Melia azedarach]|uniref:Ulp1 protease family, C-terminal catalytic domain containing protein n=1 Tax=Melia azedarach TaxID=155640 RepID=A0ACC1Y694_MELAZ|nr:Ulp1 protease family, C-terminal catalytic domain containing protein [Melia azedarach]
MHLCTDLALQGEYGGYLFPEPRADESSEDNEDTTSPRSPNPQKTSLLYTWGEYLKGKLAYGTFPPQTNLESHVERRKSTVYRAWWIVDGVYIPICISSCHWVAYVIHFHRRFITVYDSMPSSHIDQAMKGVMAPLCELIPYLLQDAIFYSTRTEIDDIDEPFTYVRPVNGIPHQQLSGDCGIFTCMYIYYLGLGRPVNFSPVDGPFFRRRIAFKLW